MCGNWNTAADCVVKPFMLCKETVALCAEIRAEYIEMKINLKCIWVLSSYRTVTTFRLRYTISLYIKLQFCPPQYALDFKSQPVNAV